MGKKVAIVTGASSGIGRAVCKALEGEGWIVAALARRKHKLDELAKESVDGRIWAMQCDVVDAEQVKKAVEEVVAKTNKVDLFVANAGIMKLSKLHKLQVAEWKEMVDINVNGVLNSAAAILPQFRSQKQGHFIVVSSDADRKVFPGSAVYSGTKAFVTLFCEGMRAELCADEIPVRVTSLSSGSTASELCNHITDKSITDGWAESTGPPMTPMTAEQFAQVVVWTTSCPEQVNINNIMFRPVTQGS